MIKIDAKLQYEKSIDSNLKQYCYSVSTELISFPKEKSTNL